MKKKWFFGWSNIKFLIKELIKLYSNEPSYFSKKRVESGIAFIVGQWGMIYFLTGHQQNLTMGEFLLWASVEFAVAGWVVNKIQKEKIENK